MILKYCISTEIPVALEIFPLQVGKKKVVFLNINMHKIAYYTSCSKKGKEKIEYVDYML